MPGAVPSSISDKNIIGGAAVDSAKPAAPASTDKKTFTNPITKEISKLDKSGLFWDKIGMELPRGIEIPEGDEIPQALIDYANNAPPYDYGAVAVRSALSVQQQNKTYNQRLLDRYTDAFTTWALTGQGKEPESIQNMFRPASFETLFNFTRKGIDTGILNPAEPTYNQG